MTNSATRYLVLYLVNGREHQSPWFSDRGRAVLALQVLQAKYGERNATIYVD
ncbi:hypothetical protein ACFOHU_03460 [Ottowia pentelensis]|uniref:Transposase n=1 Tax=Ottowia pentelensis TaxID=511108 RepID=A0ABV6PVC0_9BURK